MHGHVSLKHLLIWLHLWQTCAWFTQGRYQNLIVDLKKRNLHSTKQSTHADQVKLLRSTWESSTRKANTKMFMATGNNVLKSCASHVFKKSKKSQNLLTPSSYKSYHCLSKERHKHKDYPAKGKEGKACNKVQSLGVCLSFKLYSPSISTLWQLAARGMQCDVHTIMSLTILSSKSTFPQWNAKEKHF